LAWSNLGSHTTNRNTSHFVLLSGQTYGDGYINLQPAYRSNADSGRGVGFYWTTTDPIVFHTSGESRI
jgi:hypothetical protein